MNLPDEKREELADALAPVVEQMLAEARADGRRSAWLVAAREARERGDIGKDGGPEAWDWLTGLIRREELARADAAERPDCNDRCHGEPCVHQIARPQGPRSDAQGRGGVVAHPSTEKPSEQYDSE